MAKVEKVQFKGDDGKWVDIGWTVGDEFVLGNKSPFEVQAFPNVFVETTMTQAVPLSDVYIYGDEDFPDEACLRHRGAEFPVLVDFLNNNPYGTPSILVTMTSETEHRWRIHLAKNGLGVFPKPKPVSAVVPSLPPSALYSSHERRANELMRRIPGLQQRHEPPCGCTLTGHYSVMDAIVHLNDAHHPRLNKASHREGWEPWTREMIADWLETLPFDFTVQHEPVVRQINTWPTGFESVAGGVSEAVHEITKASFEGLVFDMEFKEVPVVIYQAFHGPAGLTEAEAKKLKDIIAKGDAAFSINKEEDK